MQSTLGKIKKITDLRSVWAHEEYDFSSWLSEEENLALLSDAIGIDIVLEELESAVGGFSVDLYASEGCSASFTGISGNMRQNLPGL